MTAHVCPEMGDNTTGTSISKAGITRRVANTSGQFAIAAEGNSGKLVGRDVAVGTGWLGGGDGLGEDIIKDETLEVGVSGITVGIAAEVAVGVGTGILRIEVDSGVLVFVGPTVVGTIIL